MWNFYWNVFYTSQKFNQCFFFFIWLHFFRFLFALHFSIQNIWYTKHGVFVEREWLLRLFTRFKSSGAHLLVNIYVPHDTNRNSFIFFFCCCFFFLTQAFDTIVYLWLGVNRSNHITRKRKITKNKYTTLSFLTKVKPRGEKVWSEVNDSVFVERYVITFWYGVLLRLSCLAFMLK